MKEGTSDFNADLKYKYMGSSIDKWLITIEVLKMYILHSIESQKEIQSVVDIAQKNISFILKGKIK